MAEEKVINYKDKQKLVFNNKPASSEVKAFGDKLIETKRYYDAVEFYEKASFKEGLNKIKQLVTDEGDLFLYKFVKRALKEEITEKEFDEIGQKAFERKKMVFAKESFKSSGNQQMLETLRNLDVNPAENSLNKVIQSSCDGCKESN